MWDPSKPTRPLSEVIEACARHSVLLKEAGDRVMETNNAYQAARVAHDEAQRKAGELQGELHFALLAFGETLAAVVTSSSESPQPPL